MTTPLFFPGTFSNRPPWALIGCCTVYTWEKKLIFSLCYCCNWILFKMCFSLTSYASIFRNSLHIFDQLANYTRTINRLHIGPCVAIYFLWFVFCVRSSPSSWPVIAPGRHWNEWNDYKNHSSSVCRCVPVAITKCENEGQKHQTQLQQCSEYESGNAIFSGSTRRLWLMNEQMYSCV